MIEEDLSKTILNTNRLILRKIKTRDAADLFEFCKDPAISRYSQWDQHTDIAETKAYIRYAKRESSDEKLNFCICFAGKVIGTCGFATLERNIRVAEIGYCISHDYQHRGFASEAIFALCDFGFNVLRLNRIEARIASENTPSCRLLDKLGFTRDALLKKGAYIKGNTYDVCLYSLTNDEFLNIYKGKVPVFGNSF